MSGIPGQGKGRRDSPETIEKRAAHRRGKTYSQIYGDRAKDEKVKRREGNRRFGHRPWSIPPDPHKGESYDQRYGADVHLQRLIRSLGHARRRCSGRFCSTRYESWRQSVLIRDDFTCQKCGSVSTSNHAHHLKSWQKFPEDRFDIDNGITLCNPCHGRSKASSNN